MKQEPQSNIINYGLPANMYTKTEAFDQHLFLSKSEAAVHYGPHYHRQRSFHRFKLPEDKHRQCTKTLLYSSVFWRITTHQSSWPIIGTQL